MIHLHGNAARVVQRSAGSEAAMNRAWKQIIKNIAWGLRIACAAPSVLLTYSLT
jgi:hypothetical protein